MDLIKNANILEQKDITTLENNNIYIVYNNSFFRNDRNVTRLMLLISFLDKYIEKYNGINNIINNIIKEYIKEIPEEINIVTENGWNAIEICVVSKYSYNETIKILVNGGANVNRISEGRNTLLHYASHCFKLNTVKLVLEHDSINIKNQQNCYAVNYFYHDEQKIKFNKILENITVLNRKN